MSQQPPLVQGQGCAEREGQMLEICQTVVSSNAERKKNICSEAVSSLDLVFSYILQLLDAGFLYEADSYLAFPEFPYFFKRKLAIVYLHWKWKWIRYTSPTVMNAVSFTYHIHRCRHVLSQAIPCICLVLLP
jgi:hypothetical protein